MIGVQEFWADNNLEPVTITERSANGLAKTGKVKVCKMSDVRALERHYGELLGTVERIDMHIGAMGTRLYWPWMRRKIRKHVAAVLSIMEDT